MKAYNILGVKFHCVDMQESVKILESFLEQDKTCLVVTVGPEMIMRAQESPEFKELVNGADLVVADGTGVLWAASRCGIKLPERVAGVELIENFASVLAKRGSDGLFLLGAAPGIAEKAGENLKKKFPELPMAGCSDGFFKEDEPVIEKIKKSGASVCGALSSGTSVVRTISSVSPLRFCRTASLPSSPPRSTQCSGQGMSALSEISTSEEEKPVTAAPGITRAISCSSSARDMPTSCAGSSSLRCTLWPQGA